MRLISMIALRAARSAAALSSLLALGASGARAQNADWPVYGGNTDHTHYTTLGQISPANVKRLKVAWTFDTKDAFTGSEMQTNPIVIDGVLYVTTAWSKVYAFNAKTGRRLWSGVGVGRRFVLATMLCIVVFLQHIVNMLLHHLSG